MGSSVSSSTTMAKIQQEFLAKKQHIQQPTKPVEHEEEKQTHQRPSSSSSSSTTSSSSSSSPLRQERVHIAKDMTFLRDTISSSSSSYAISSLSSAEILQSMQQKYQSGKVLGSGASATVYEVTERSTGRVFACKVITRNASMNDAQTMAMELHIMLRLQAQPDSHQHSIIACEEVYVTQDSLYFVLELATGGDLLYGLAKMTTQEYSEENIKPLFRQLLLAVQALHRQGIVHRDLKMDNLLYSTTSEHEYEEHDKDTCCSSSTSSSCRSSHSGNSSSIEVKITDFGLSTMLAQPFVAGSSRQSKRYSGLKDMWGTPEYFAPEVYAKAYGPQVDVWALGCILYELLTGVLAFPHGREVPVQLLERVLFYHGHKPPRSFETHAHYQQLSAEVKSLLKGMLKRNPQQRLSLEECLQHIWVTEPSTPAQCQPLQDAHQVFVRRVERRQRRQQEQARQEAARSEEKRQLAEIKLKQQQQQVVQQQ